MLKHEEMIENVHRRIAQYEEEQKMKHSKNIKFFSAKPDIKTEENRTNEDGYIDVVSGTDIVRPANKVLRIVSTAAAAALLVTGIGATGFLMQRNKSNNKNKSENEVYLTEATDSNLVKPISDNSVAPFADFNQLLFSLYIINQDIEEYSDVTYNKLATFLNGFNWGEGAEIAESDIPDFDEYEGNGYGIFWKNGDLYFNVYITEDGKAYYIKTKCNPIGGAFEYPVTDSAVFNIDYDSFDKGVKDILKQNKPETGNSLSQMEIKRLSEGKFQEAELYYEMGIGSEQIIPEKAETKNALSKFLEKDFLTMLKKSGSDSDSANELMYMVVRCFKTNDTTVCRESFFIYTSGFVNLCSYDLTDKDEIPTGTWNYYIDISEFETRINDVLAGKYDEAIPEAKKDKKNDKKDEKIQEITQPTTEKQKTYDRPSEGISPNEKEQENAHPTEVTTENTTAVTTEPDPCLTDFYGDNYDTRRPQVVIYDDVDTDKYEAIASYKTHDNDILDAFVADKLPGYLNEWSEDYRYIPINKTYFIVRIYKNSKGNIQRDSYSIFDRGSATFLSYEYSDEYTGEPEWWPAGAENYTINFEAFEEEFMKCLKEAELEKK